MPYELTDQQKQQFEADGYLVVPRFFSQDQASELLERSRTLLREFDLEGHPMTKFHGTADVDQSHKHVGDRYFLDSASNISYFFEPAAFDPSTGLLNRPKELSVNKIGHALANLDPSFRRFTFSEDVQSVVKSLGSYEDPRVIQSMVICKNREVGGKVGSHDDQTFLTSEPSTAMGLWFALEDCTESNGCLSFVPGSHKTNRLTKRLVRLPEGGTDIVPVPAYEDEPNVDWDAEGVQWVAAPCKAGDLVLIHGAVIHRSERNLSDKSRFIYTFHCIEGSAKWDELNWLQPAEDMPFAPLYTTPPDV